MNEDNFTESTRQDQKYALQMHFTDITISSKPCPHMKYTFYEYGAVHMCIANYATNSLIPRLHFYHVSQLDFICFFPLNKE